MGRFLALSIFAVLIVMSLFPVWVTALAFAAGAVPWVILAVIVGLFISRPRRARWRHRYSYVHAPDCSVAHKRLRRQESARWANYPRQAAPVQTSARPAGNARPSPARAADLPDKLPAEAKSKIDRIRRKAAQLQKQMAEAPVFSLDLYILQQITQDYLPRTIDSFLSVPAQPSELFPLVTYPADELSRQLDLLERKLDDLATNLRQHDMDGLIANRRFLEERFAARPPILS